MDKKHGRSEQRFDADYQTGRKKNRPDRERSGGQRKRGKEDEKAWKPSAVMPKKTYPRPRPDRQFTNIDDYLADWDRKFGKTSDVDSDLSSGMEEGEKGQDRFERACGNRRDRKRNLNGVRPEEETGKRSGRERNPGGDRPEKSTGRGKNRRRNRNGGRPEEDGRERTRQEPDSVRHEAAPSADEASDSENRIEGRNSVQEAFRSGRFVDHLYVQQGLNDGPIATIRRMAKKAGTTVSYVPKERLDRMSVTGHHQGVIASVASYEYSTVEAILEKAKEKGEDPFLFLLDGIEDPQNLGAIIRTANLAGAHGVIIAKHRAAGLTAAVVRASAGALNFTPVAKVTNLGSTIDELKKDGMWFVCADMKGTSMYDLEMKGAVGLVIGSEGEGVSRLIREKCDFAAAIPMRGDIDSLNASVAAGILAFEIARQRGR